MILHIAGAVAEQVKIDILVVTDALPVLIAYIDTNLHYRSNNKAYKQWFNKPLDQITGVHIKEILGDAEFGQFLDHYRELLQGKQVDYETSLYFHED